MPLGGGGREWDGGEGGENEGPAGEPAVHVLGCGGGLGGQLGHGGALRRREERMTRRPAGERMMNDVHGTRGEIPVPRAAVWWGGVRGEGGMFCQYDGTLR